MANISAIKLPDGVTYNIKDDVSGYITGMTILSYGSSTWQNFINAYNANKVVYCRASSNSNPATGSQTRLAFMAYVNNATTPTEVEFQYYRSVSSHSANQQGDQVYVYKLNKNTGWSVTVREAMSKIAVGGDLTSSYAKGTITISGDIPTVPTNVSAFTNDAGYLTTETDPTVPSWAKAESKPTYTYSEVGAAASSHSHGNITSGGDITTTATIANGDRIIINDESASKVTNSSITFGTSDSQYLANSGTWQNLPTIPTKVSDLTNDSGYITGYTETDPIFSASAAAGIQSTDITKWNKIYNLYNVSSENSGSTYWWKLTVSQNGLYNYTNAPGSGGALGKICIPNGKSGGSTTYINFVSDTDRYNTNLTFNLPNKDGTIALWSDIPTKVSDLTNDAGYITSYDLGNYVENYSSTNLDSFITTNDGDDNARLRMLNDSTNKMADLTWYAGNDSAFTFNADHIGAVINWTPTNNQDFTTKKYVDDSIGAISIPTKVSDLTNDAGYLTTETDPTVPNWAKASSKPSYTASEVGAVPTSRTVNGKALSSNITLSASDVSAQETLVSGTNIKTVNSTSLLGSGDVAVQPTLVSGTNIKTINGNSILGSGDLPIEASSADVTQVSITVANWNATTTCTKSVTGVTTSNSIIVSPAPESIPDYVASGVYCSAQAAGTLTFECTSTPTADLVVNVMIVG